MTTLLLLLAVFFFSIQPIAMKKIKDASLRVNILQTGIFSLAVAVCFWIWAAAAKFTFSAPTILCGALFGAGLIATIACYYYAMHSGPLSYTSFFYSASMIIPAVAGPLFWKDEFRWTAGLGIALFLAAFYFISVPGSPARGKGGRKWLLLCAATWFLNGSLSVLVKAQQMATGGREASSLTTLAFSFAFVFAVAAYFILAAASGEASKTAAEISGMKRYALPLLALAVGNGGGNFTLTYLSGRVSSAYLFPVVNGGMMVAVTLYSVLVLKEKINKYGAAGIGLGVAALIVLNLA
jgi:drug/metabolite transporter (DMT)-like permease